MYGMGAEEGGGDVYRRPHLDRPCRPQHSQLGVEVEPVAGLHLDRGDALRQQRPQAAQRRLEELLLGGGTGGADGRENRSEEHTSELQSLMRISYSVFCWKQ